MTFKIKVRGSGAPVLADYECPIHGRMELRVERDEHGDPPASIACPDFDLGLRPVRRADGSYTTESIEQACELRAVWRPSAPQIKRLSVPCYAETRGGDTERRPGMLDTRPLAEGQSLGEWRKTQASASQERRHHQLIAKGLKTRRVQV